jgi:AcrR family transcriptional regulator
MIELMTLKERPRRSDARRNVEIILSAAREVFAESGYGTSIAEVARRSSLGMGTVYRHFPNKSALMERVAVEVMRELLDVVEKALASDDEPWEIFRRVFRKMGAVRSSELFPASRGRTSDAGPELIEARSALLKALDRLVRQAQESGRMRTDVNVYVVVLGRNAGPPCMTTRPEEVAGVDHADRHLGLLLDGLRAPAAEALTDPAPSRRDVDLFFRARHDL